MSQGREVSGEMQGALANAEEAGRAKAFRPAAWR